MAIVAIHPGEHLVEELEELEMSAAELARKMNVPTNRVTQILNGTRAVTGDTALRLAHFFGTSAQFWLNLQTLYDLRVAEEKAGKSIKTLPKLKRRGAGGGVKGNTATGERRPATGKSRLGRLKSPGIEGVWGTPGTQRLPFGSAQGRRTGLTSYAPPGLGDVHLGVMDNRLVVDRRALEARHKLAQPVRAGKSGKRKCSAVGATPSRKQIWDQMQRHAFSTGRRTLLQIRAFCDALADFGCIERQRGCWNC